AAPPAPSADFLEHAERVDRPVRPSRIEPGTPTAGPHLPGRPMARNGVLLITRNGVVAHPSEEIVGMVVLAHMFQAEAPIFMFPSTPLRRPMGGGIAASGPFARRTLRPQPAVVVGLDPDAIVDGRIEFHDLTLCEVPRRSRKIDKP